MVQTIFEKALLESSYSKLYAYIFDKLQTNSDKLIEPFIKIDINMGNYCWTIEGSEGGCSKKLKTEEEARKDALASLKLRKLIISNIQGEFNKDTKAKEILEKFNEFKKEPKPLESTPEFDVYNEKYEDLVSQELKIKQRLTGIMKLIGELFLLKNPVMTDKIIVSKCIPNLLDSKETYKIDALCKLLLIVGKKLEEAKENTEFIRYMEQLKVLYEDKDNYLSSTVRFQILEILEIRRNRWIELPRSAHKSPKPHANSNNNYVKQVFTKQTKQASQDVRDNKPTHIIKSEEDKKADENKNVDDAAALWSEYITKEGVFRNLFYQDVIQKKISQTEVKR